MPSDAPGAHGQPASEAVLTAEELSTLVRLGKRALWAGLDTRRAIQAERINVVPANFYSDIPSLAEIESSFEFTVADGPYNDPGVFDRDRMNAFLTIIDRYADEFDPPVEGDIQAPQGYFWRNPAFSYSDAMAYYCILRHHRPNRVIEIGSGFSTLVALRALQENGAGEVCCVEPFPMPWLQRLASRVDLVREKVQALPPSFFNERLSDGDLLFIDSTHTVKAGSDCLHIYLRLLPALTARLMVHAHDIYLPFPLPRSQFDRHVYWTEQYLLYAYLLDNPRTSVVYGSVYDKRFLSSGLERLMRGRWSAGGASLWWEFNNTSPPTPRGSHDSSRDSR